MNERRGYTRGRILAAGTGAAEVWTAVLDGLGDGHPTTVGEVSQGYERSAYLEFTPQALGPADLLGPPLVLLAGGDIDGPLATTVTTSTPGGPPLDQLAAGAPARVWPASRATGRRPRYVLRVGDALDLVIDPDRLTVNDEPDRRYHDLAAIRREGELWARSLAAVDLLATHDLEDGLGWLPALAGFGDDEDLPTGDLRALVDGWVAWLASAGGPTDPPPADILGRGPGATPSGDDVLSGVVLALFRTTVGERRSRVRAAGEQLLKRASKRTTTVSTALFAQAVQGRAGERVEAVLRGLLRPDVPRSRWEPPVRETAALGHTSGVDTLVGVLLVTLAIGPRLARTG